MNSQISKLTAFVFFVAALLTSCYKDPFTDKPMPGPGKPNAPVDTGSFRFTTAIALSGYPYHSSNLAAVVSITNDKNDTVFTEKVLRLDVTGDVKTENLKLPAGTYKLAKFRLVYGTVNTHFAAPIAGSSKAAQVQQPLTLAFKVVKGTTTDVPVEVLRVQEGERPALFGYPSGAFDNGQSDASPYLKVKFTALMQVGKINYDTVPATLALTTWDNNGERSLAFISLKAGINEVPVLKSAARYQFDISKWGISERIMVERQHVTEDTVYVFRGVKAAKLLKSETTYKLVNGTYKAESKNEYVYDAAGNLSRINHFLKRADNSPYVAMTDVFELSDGRVQKITRYDEAYKQIGVTPLTYDQLGRVDGMAQNEGGTQTTASVTYLDGLIGIHYTYSDQTYTKDYEMQFHNGNVYNYSTYIEGQSRESGSYNYDDGINPYIHMNWPNLFLSNTSKNNVTTEYKTYYGNHPDALPYNFQYSYDADGYPTQLIKQFHSYGDHNYMYTTKTVYVY